MYELRPLLLLTLTDGVPVLRDLLNKQSFKLENTEILTSLQVLIDNMPASKSQLAESCQSSLGMSLDGAEAMIEILIDEGIIVPSSTIHAQKAGIQKWIDKGWIDALVLHFASRNLSYSDDPIEYGGSNDLESTPSVLVRKESENECIVTLPNASCINASELISGILNRRSFKAFIKKRITAEELSDILWYPNVYSRDRSFIKLDNLDVRSRDIVYDSAFSALSTYIVIFQDVELNSEISNGVYRYNVESHSLTLIEKGDFREDLARLAIGQRRAASGVLTFVFCADWLQYKSRYPHERAYRNLLINVAQLAQFYLTVSTIKNFNTFLTPAIHDEAMFTFLKLKEKLPLYIVTIG